MKKIILILPVIAGIMFGGAGIFVRILTEAGINNQTVLFSRAFVATIEMLIFILIYDRNLLKIKIRHIPIFLGTGILGMLGLNLCYNEAINRLTLSLSAVLLSTAPIFVIFIAALVFKEKITVKKICCMIFAIIGCIMASGLLEQHSSIIISSLGLITGVAAAIFYALYSVFSRIATDYSYSTYTVIFYSVLTISVVLIPFSDYSSIITFIEEDLLRNIIFLLAHSLCTSVLPYIFLTLSLRYAEAGKVSILASGGEPVAAVIFGVIFYSEIPSLMMMVGLAVVIASLTFLCVEKSPHN